MDVNETEKELEYAKADRNMREKDVRSARQNFKNAAIPLNEAANVVQKCQLTIDELEQNITECRDEERELNNRLAEIAKHRKGLEHDLGESQIGIAHAREHEEEMKAVNDEAEAAFKECVELLRKADADVLQRQREADAIIAQQRSMRDALKMQEDAIEDLRGALKPFRDNEQRHRGIHMEAERAVNEHDDVVRELELELADTKNTRREVELDEHPLLEHEIRLREQRYNLAERDDVHWDETTKFMTVTGRSDTRGGIVGSKMFSR